MRRQEYDDFVDALICAVKRRWPHILLQWEDFAGSNASRLLERYRDQLCTFNDDIQGTAAVATAAVLGAVMATGIPMKEQRIGFLGFGSAGIGIANLILASMKENGLTEEEAHTRFYPVDRYGLILEGQDGPRPDQTRYARMKSDLEGWKISDPQQASLLDVVRNAKLTVLIGVSSQAGAFTEEIVREMAKYTDRPAIFPLSNPTSKSEATPADLTKWTSGRALIGTGSPYSPIEVDGRPVQFAQTNNSHIFPGLALGILTSQAKRVSDGMIMAATKALAAVSPMQKNKEASLLPPIADSRSVGLKIAAAVGRQAIAERIAGVDDKSFEKDLSDYVWEPVYRPYVRLND